MEVICACCHLPERKEKGKGKEIKKQGNSKKEKKERNMTKILLAGDQLGGCDVTNQTSAVQSVNYPSGYPDGRDTFWHLVAVHSSRTFSLHFQDFALEASSSCQNDWLYVR